MPRPTTDSTVSSSDLRILLETRDPDAFETSLDSLCAGRRKDTCRALGHLTRDLHNAVVQLTAAPATQPSSATTARRQLDEALAMDASAAHETLATIELLRPQAIALGTQARRVLDAPPGEITATHQLAHDASGFVDSCLDAFTHLVEKQSWQDLSGQRLKMVAAFVEKVEVALIELARLTQSLGSTHPTTQRPPQHAPTQNEVDRLLSEFGL